MGIENIVAKGEIAHNKQLLPFLQQFQLYSVILLSFEEIFHYNNRLNIILGMTKLGFETLT